MSGGENFQSNYGNINWWFNFMVLLITNNNLIIEQFFCATNGINNIFDWKSN